MEKGGFMVSKRNVIMVVLLLMVAITACSKSPETARKELGQMNIDYTQDSFFNYVERGDKVVVELFLAAGMSPNSRQSGFSEKTILMVAAKKGNEEIMKLLISKGADVNGKDKYGFTALIDAVIEGNAEIVKVLLNKGADVRAKVTDGAFCRYDSMDFALQIKKRNPEIFKALLNKGDYNDKELGTILFFAKEIGYTEAVDILKKAGVKE